MPRTRSRITRRRHSRVAASDRPAAAAELSASRLQQSGHDPRDSRMEVGMRPYEVAYDVSRGYTGERPILLP
jgi:hypothetical protein